MVDAKSNIQDMDEAAGRAVRKNPQLARQVQIQRYLIIFAVFGIGAMMLVGSVSAESLIDVTNITDTLKEIGSNLFGGILALVIGAWPVMIVIGIMMFVNKFLWKILDLFGIF